MRVLKQLWIKVLLLFNIGSSRPFVNRMPMRLQFFAEGGEGGAGGGTSSTGGGAGGGTGGGDGGKGGGETYFATFKTEDDLKSKLTDAEKQGQLSLAKSLGFETVEAMQEALKQQKPPKNNEGGKGGKEGEKTPDVDAIIDEKLKDEREKTFERLKRSEVKIQANEIGFADWEDALALADLTQVKEDDHGNIIGVDVALKTLADKKPHLLKQQQKQGGSFGAPAPNQSGGGQKVVGYDAGKSIAEQRNQGGKK